MKYSGLYLIPSHANAPDASHNTITSLINSIESHFEHAARQEPWNLTHRLFRSTPTPPSSNQQQQQQAPPQQKLHHILRLSHLSSTRTYCYIHSFVPTAAGSIKSESQSNAPTPQPNPQRTDTGTIISFPSQSTEPQTGFVASQLQPLWALRHILNVNNGVTYTLGQFIIHIGELKPVRISASSSSTSSGVVVCISTITEDDGGLDEDSEMQDSGYSSLDGLEGKNQDTMQLDGAEEAIRNLWTVIKDGIEFGKAEIREVMMDKSGLKQSKRSEIEAAVRMWCDVLRLRV